MKENAGSSGKAGAIASKPPNPQVFFLNRSQSQNLNITVILQ
jgi:hypothetical protein